MKTQSALVGKTGPGTLPARSRIIRASRLLPLLLVLGLTTVVEAQFSYTVENGTVTITKYTGPGGDVIIPDTIDGLTVISIGRMAFGGVLSLTSVTIPNSVTSIGDYAFLACRILKTVTISDSVTSIGENAFWGCWSLTSVTIPGSVTSIAHNAFLECTSLANVTIGNGVTSIGDGAFSSCRSLTSITIPDSVTSIGYYAFDSCTGLTNVTIGSGVTSIGWGAFSGCTRLGPVYFRGNAPRADPGGVFEWAYRVMVYFLPGTTGWGSSIGDRLTALWIQITPTPSTLAADNPLRLVTHSPAPATVRVQRSANLVDWEDWQTVSRNGGPSELHDTDAGTAPYRFYRGIEE